MEISALVGNQYCSVIVGTHVYLYLCGLGAMIFIAGSVLTFQICVGGEVLNPLLLDCVKIW
jgi:hypothetical protein